MTTPDDALLLYPELTDAQVRAVQRRVRQGTLARIVPGLVTSLPESAWPGLIARERIRVLAALYPDAVIGPRNAFAGGVPVEGVMVLVYSHTRRVELPGLTVQLVAGHGPAPGDVPMMGRALYFPSPARVLLENLAVSRGRFRKSVGKVAVEQRLIDICEARGEDALNALRDQARALAPLCGLEREFALLDGLVGAVPGTRKVALSTATGKGLTAVMPYDGQRLALFEVLAARLRARPLKQPAGSTRSERARQHFAFLESYFSNFIEGTEFDVNEARGFVLEGKPIGQRPKDSHDIIGVFRQALHPAWADQTLLAGEPVLQQLCARHADQMQARPEVGPGQFKTTANRAGGTEFVLPRLVRGTLVEGSRLLPSVPPGSARALLAMFLVAEVHPFVDGNGRLARLVMNAELSAAGACRIIVPTLFRDEYLDCLRLLSRQGDPGPWLDAMQWIQDWTSSFDYENLDEVIARMQACNAFEKSRTQYRLQLPTPP
jgi:hypothetical protein